MGVAAHQDRLPAGIPSGGQFATTARERADMEMVELDPWAGLNDEPSTTPTRSAPAGDGTDPEHPIDSTDPRVQSGEVLDEIVVDGQSFSRVRDGVGGNWPYAMRLQANRPLSDDEMQTLAGLTGYAYRAGVAGESLGDPERDSPYSFVVGADTTKSQRDDLSIALEDFEEMLPAMAREGSPVRKTDRAGVGTKGTRLVDGLGEDLVVHLYYDDVWRPKN